MYMLPQSNCQLNPIERVWAQAKKYSKAYCNYSIRSLHNTIHQALESVLLDTIENDFKKVGHYMFAYLEGVPGGSNLRNW